MASGGDSMGYWAHIPIELPEPPNWKLPPAVIAAMEGRGSGMYGITMTGGMPFNYGWPKYGPVSQGTCLQSMYLGEGRRARHRSAD